MADTTSPNRTKTPEQSAGEGVSEASHAPGTAPAGADDGTAPQSPPAKGTARLPLIVGATALAGLAGWVVVAGRNARRTILGVRLPRVGSRSPREVVSDGAREVGGALGRLPGIGRVRDRLGR